MRKLPTRQVHLDFHTSEDIPGVGSAFSKENFQEALRLGNLNSITVFAKGHHGWCYYPTQVGTPHPTLAQGFDLTGAMIDAAHEIGVDCPVYITAGWSAQDARRHPEWAMRTRDGRVSVTNVDPDAAPGDPRPICSWTDLCLNGDGPYAQHIYALTREVCDRYPQLDGLFYDIVYIKGVCYCPACLEGMRRAGLDPEKEEDARAYYVQSHILFADRCQAILREKHPDATIFFNSGGADIYRPEYHPSQTHYEMEDLPTAWGGYNKMVPRASVMRRYGKDYLGMTGKFHTTWGEFGGYKNPEALRFEVAMMAMYGARCSVGDQMPPSGRMDLSTYRLIGHAYRYLERIEPWCYGEESTTRLGVYLSRDTASDQGLHSMLLEKQLDFTVVLPGDDLSAFDAVILPDCVQLSAGEAARLQAFARQGGGVLLTGESAVKDGAFQLDTGLVYQGRSQCDVDYLKAGPQLTGCDWLDSPFLCYQSAVRTQVQDAEVLGQVYEPWFNRTYGRYCSHQFTPYRDEPAAYPGIARKGNIVYLAHNLCRMYKTDGAQLFRDILCGALRLIYRPVMEVSMPSAGRARLTRQGGRYVLHLMYGSPIQRGRTSVIEDLPALRDIPVTLRISEPLAGAILQPQGQPVAFTQAEGLVTLTVPQVACHQMVELTLR